MKRDAADEPKVQLTEEQFPAFFEEVHGWQPFPWQESLLHKVVTEGWPALIDVPTGLGKTAVLDVAVFASAMGSTHTRRRVFMVVDRRLIVDQAHDHALRIHRAIEDAPDGSLCHAVGLCLVAQGDDGPAVDVTRMRGGADWSWLWLERPDRHAIVTGTVDQVGSRLLFRGYGVGDRLKPIDAALAGTDSLIIIDEAHLSEALLSTLRDIRAIEDAQAVPAPIVVAMSASPGQSGANTHRIGIDDEQHPVAGRRLRAEKTVRLVTVPRSSATVDALVHWARELGGRGKVTGVVTNTVATARAAFSKLCETLPEPEYCVLMTGRIRPVDRDYLQHAWYPRIRAGAERTAEKAIFVVATQTIEVGADIDLDGLVTESASIQAIVQRLGRVNRRGDQAGTAVIVHTGGSADSIYGPARQQTWDWLTSISPPTPYRASQGLAQLGEAIPMSPAQLRDLVDSIPAAQRESMTGPQPYVPLLSADTLDCWSRTSPRPHPDVPVAPYLHGLGYDYPTVSVVWRADIGGDDPGEWQRSVERIPPTIDEAIELPIAAARRWLAGRRRGSATASRGAAIEPELAVSDLEVPPDLAGRDEDASRPADDGPTVLRYRDASHAEAVSLRQLRPNDLLVVPATWGGCDQYGWDPDSAEPVIDVADLTGGGRRGRVTAIRVGTVLSDAVKSLAPDVAEKVEDLISAIEADIGDDDTDESRYQQVIRQIAAELPPPAEGSNLPHERVLRSLADASRLALALDKSPDRHVKALLSRRGVSWSDDTSAGGTSVTGESEPMTLADHQKAVGKRAAEFACNLGLADPVVRAVRLAGEHHDEGKRDRRFQVMLHRGDRWRAGAAGEPLAKSGMDPADRAARGLAQRLSGYPQFMRHEALSARLAAALLARDLEEPAVDADLVRHLIASHHGHARPLLPPVTDPEPIQVEIPVAGATLTLRSDETVDWDGPDRFAILTKTYGRWGLALLEAIVRLADMWCSARSERGEDESDSS